MKRREEKREKVTKGLDVHDNGGGKGVNIYGREEKQTYLPNIAVAIAVAVIVTLEMETFNFLPYFVGIYVGEISGKPFRFSVHQSIIKRYRRIE